MSRGEGRRPGAQIAAIAASLAAATVLAGCGSSDTSTEDASASEMPPGEKVFIAAGCGACHTLRDAGSTGDVGTDLDRANPSAEHVERFVTNGGVGMPSFDGVLTRQDIVAVSRYVSEVSGW